MKKLKIGIIALMFSGMSYAQSVDTLASGIAGKIHFKSRRNLYRIEPLAGLPVEILKLNHSAVHSFENYNCFYPRIMNNDFITIN